MKPEGKRPLGRTRLRWKYSIRIDIKENVWHSVEGLIGSGHGQVAGSYGHDDESLSSIKCYENFLTS